MPGRFRPAYDLAEIQSKVEAGEYFVTRTAQLSAETLSFDQRDVARCVLALRRADFYKTMAAEKAPGLWQDVYRPTFQGVALYVKLQIAVQGNAVVISFKER